jgi:transposase
MSSQLVSDELLARQSPEAQAIIRLLLAKIAELETRLNQSPRNSSLPPSTEHPHAKPTPDKPKSKKKRGGQPGHKKHERALIPSEQCQQVIERRPTVCRRCQERLPGDDAAPLRHQVWELPVIRPKVTEYRLHRLTCPGCGATTCGTLPADVPTGQSGPRLTAFVGLLMGHFRQSKRRAALFLQDLLGFPCCPATTVKMQNQVSAALAEPYEELRRQLAHEPQLNMDETPTKQANAKAWLWTAVAPLFAVFAIFSSRKGTALPKLLGDAFAGVINCDRAKMYWQARRLQWCWSHLIRDFQALIEHPDHQVKRLGHDVMREVKAMFVAWKRYKAKEIDWPTFQTLLQPIRTAIDGYLLRGVFSGNKRLRGMCQELWRHRDWLWTFVDVQGIEPTNNAAERALRPAVIYRKLSFGTQSEAGSRFVERMLTMSETCRLQNRSIFAYLVSAVEAHFGFFRN